VFKKNIFESFVKKKINKNEAEKKDRDFKYLEKESENEIFDFQKEKEKLVEKMHQLLKIADEGGEISFGEKDLISVGLDDEGKYQTFGKNPGNITKGDIAVASIWGKNLKLNSEIDRKTKKEFILRETRREISKLWNKQLSLMVKDSRETNHIKSIQGLEESAKYEENQEYEKIKGGHLAEKMVNSFFTKILENNDFPFSIEEADVYDDAIDKIDFYFHIKKEYTRGLNIEACGEEKDCIEKNNIGIQYTMNKDAIEKKKKQIESARKRVGVDDIVLVTVPLDHISEALEKWKADKKNRSDFSGPERFLDDNLKEKLFKSLLSNLPKELNINSEEYWEKIKNQV